MCIRDSALARAIVIHPQVLLMDEPLSNLDAKLRVEMRNAITHIGSPSGATRQQREQKYPAQQQAACPSEQFDIHSTIPLYKNSAHFIPYNYKNSQKSGNHIRTSLPPNRITCR